MKQTKSNHVRTSTLGIKNWLLSLGDSERATPADEALERQRLEDRLNELHRNARCVRRSLQLMLFLTAFAIVGLGYSTVLIPDWPQTMRQFLLYWPIKAHMALGLASFVCAIVFLGLGLLYRRELSCSLQQIQRMASETIESASPKIVPLVVGTPSAKVIEPDEFKADEPILDAA